VHQLPSSPAARRNREPIAEILRNVLPKLGVVLELASGTGEHAAFFAEHFPKLRWQPSDPDPAALAAIDAWREQAGLGNLEAPLRIDAEEQPWPVARADAILCVNMVHISRWEATQGLMRGAGLLLPIGAPLILYGPYLRQGVPTAPSNLAFDQSLRSRNRDWGLRDVAAVTAEAEAQGLRFERLIEMPANNLTLLFRRL
jgi:SAM-dependent methyltransferase